MFDGVPKLQLGGGVIACVGIFVGIDDLLFSRSRLTGSCSRGLGILDLFQLFRKLTLLTFQKFHLLLSLLGLDSLLIQLLSAISLRFFV